MTAKAENRGCAVIIQVAGKHKMTAVNQNLQAAVKSTPDGGKFLTAKAKIRQLAVMSKPIGRWILIKAEYIPGISDCTPVNSPLCGQKPLILKKENDRSTAETELCSHLPH